MTIRTVLDQVLAMDRLVIPKRAVDDRIHAIFGHLLEDHGETWKVRCSHCCNSESSEKGIQEAQTSLELTFPEQLCAFLRLADGAQLFVVPRIGLEPHVSNTFHVRYKLCWTEELVSKNRQLLEYFRRCLGNDPDFAHFERLNYVVYCDISDGNYLAILLEGEEAGKVFYLDRELSARPYTAEDADMYYTVAESLKEWFVLLRDTGGWGGRGMMTGGF